MNKRIRFTIIFSTPNFPYQSVMDWLSPKLGELFAGACCQPIDGIWSEDGEHDKEVYQAGVQEKGMKILLSVTLDKEEQAKLQIKQLLQGLKQSLNLPISWVHIEQEEVFARHIQLD
ncbi:hypothetical protein WNY51_13830 [Pseudocolwellia sp. AS88]|uniref:hypothetical protein n=1 Tax=Pseudocolwellia TaxID=2848177 RepID=UPI0026F30D3F|nr:hypothetical protein [Pseudocolwellia sp. AS88]MDO7083990.1 hypothetical protein [Pseudocolwellia sp. AS88]